MDLDDGKGSGSVKEILKKINEIDKLSNKP